MISWPAALDAEILRVAGPEDEFDGEANGDPDSVIGEDAEDGFEVMADYPDEADLGGEFDDADLGDDEDTEIEDDEDE